MLRLYDTASSRVVELSPRDPGHFGLYVCGPTVYGPPHVGHGRFALVYDVLRRYLSYRGFVVHHVSNITDIDDKIINRANAEHRPWQDIAAESEAEWWFAMDRMGLERPTDEPHATAFIPQMVDLIDALVTNGSAYETSDGVYLSVASVADYGLLKHQDLESLLAGARVDVIEEKRSPSDFALWKKAKPSEPSWASPFGDGRPGWHTECVAMSLDLLGEGFDLHGGGQDLIFPHHENERAQAAALGRPFSRTWVHNGLVTVGGEKMSKSLGNFLTLAELLEDCDPRAYRLLVLRAHYRSPLEVTQETLADAGRALSRIDSIARLIAEIPSIETVGFDDVHDRFIAAMDDDLNTPRATGDLFDAIRNANSLLDNGDTVGGVTLARRALQSFEALGISRLVSASDVDAASAEKVSQRDRARADKDFATADRLRAELEADGWIVEDTATGTRVHR